MNFICEHNPFNVYSENTHLNDINYLMKARGNLSHEWVALCSKAPFSAAVWALPVLGATTLHDVASLVAITATGIISLGAHLSGCCQETFFEEEQALSVSLCGTTLCYGLSLCSPLQALAVCAVASVAISLIASAFSND